MALRLWAPLKPIMVPNVAVYPPENAQRNQKPCIIFIQC